MQVRPVLEFGCILYAGARAYKLGPLVMLQRLALRLCLGLPKFVAIKVLYLETTPVTWFEFQTVGCTITFKALRIPSKAFRNSFYHAARVVYRSPLAEINYSPIKTVIATNSSQKRKMWNWDICYYTRLVIFSTHSRFLSIFVAELFCDNFGSP